MSARGLGASAGPKRESPPRPGPMLVEQLALAIRSVFPGEEDPAAWPEDQAPDALALLTFARRVDPGEHPRAARWVESVGRGGWLNSAEGIVAQPEAIARLRPLALDLLGRLSGLGLVSGAREAKGEIEAGRGISYLDLPRGGPAGFVLGMDVGAGLGDFPRGAADALRSIAAAAEAFALERGLEGADVEIVSFLGLSGFAQDVSDERSAASALAGKRVAEEAEALGLAAAEGERRRPRPGI